MLVGYLFDYETFELSFHLLNGHLSNHFLVCQAFFGYSFALVYFESFVS